MLRAALISVALLAPSLALADRVDLDPNFVNSPKHSSSGKPVKSQRIHTGTVRAATPKAKSVQTSDPWGSSSSMHSHNSHW
jgi:hypothetical protein